MAHRGYNTKYLRLLVVGLVCFILSACSSCESSDQLRQPETKDSDAGADVRETDVGDTVEGNPETPDNCPERYENAYLKERSSDTGVSELSIGPRYRPAFAESDLNSRMISLEQLSSQTLAAELETSFTAESQELRVIANPATGLVTAFGDERIYLSTREDLSGPREDGSFKPGTILVELTHRNGERIETPNEVESFGNKIRYRYDGFDVSYAHTSRGLRYAVTSPSEETVESVEWSLRGAEFASGDGRIVSIENGDEGEMFRAKTNHDTNAELNNAGGKLRLTSPEDSSEREAFRGTYLPLSAQSGHPLVQNRRILPLEQKSEDRLAKILWKPYGFPNTYSLYSISSKGTVRRDREVTFQNTSGALVLDFNDDGRSDVLTRPATGSTHTLWAQNEEGGFDKDSEFDAPCRHMELISDDSNNELRIYEACSGQKDRIWTKAGSGADFKSTRANISGDPAYPAYEIADIAAGDLNNDGTKELIMATEDPDAGYRVYETGSDGTLTYRLSFGEGAAFSRLHLLDIDGNGYRDVVVGKRSSGGFRHRVWLNDEKLSLRKSEHSWESTSFRGYVSGLLGQPEPNTPTEAFSLIEASGLSFRTINADGDTSSVSQSAELSLTDAVGAEFIDYDDDARKELVTADHKFESGLLTHEIPAGGTRFFPENFVRTTPPESSDHPEPGTEDFERYLRSEINGIISNNCQSNVRKCDISAENLARMVPGVQTMALANLDAQRREATVSDGDLDLFAGTKGPDYLFERRSLQMEQTWTSDDSETVVDVEVGDIHADGRLNAIVAMSSGTYFGLSRRDGGGWRVTRAFTNSSSIEDIELANLDDEPGLEVWVARGTVGAIIWDTSSSGGFVYGYPYREENMPPGDSLVLDDFDGDGLTDAIISNDEGSNRLLMNNGSSDGFFRFSKRSDVSIGSDTEVIESRDLNGDDKPDVIADGQIWLNRSSEGDIKFEQSQNSNLSPGAALTDIETGLINDDDAHDILLTRANEPNTIWFNDGSGRFQNAIELNAPGEYGDIADLTGDGASDILITGSQSEPTALINDDDADFWRSRFRFDGHRLGDFALASPEPNGATVLLSGLNRGGFESWEAKPQSFVDWFKTDADSNTRAVAAGRLLNCDKSPDIVAVTDEGVHLLENTGTAEPPLTSNGLLGDGAYPIADVAIKDIADDVSGEELLIGSSTERHLLWGAECNACLSRIGSFGHPSLKVFPHGETRALSIDTEPFLFETVESNEMVQTRTGWGYRSSEP
jgi:hypothetical protein